MPLLLQQYSSFFFVFRNYSNSSSFVRPLKKSEESIRYKKFHFSVSRNRVFIKFIIAKICSRPACYELMLYCLFESNISRVYLTVQQAEIFHWSEGLRALISYSTGLSFHSVSFWPNHSIWTFHLFLLSFQYLDLLMMLILSSRCFCL